MYKTYYLETSIHYKLTQELSRTKTVKKNRRMISLEYKYNLKLNVEVKYRYI